MDSTGGPGSNGTVRMQMEWDIVDLSPLANEIESAEVILHTLKGSVDSLDTSFYVGDFNQDGLLTDSDYQASTALIPGVVMPVPGGVGTVGTFTFDVTAQLQDAIANGLSFFSIQGRVDEGLAGQGFQRGLQVYTTADGNLAAFLEPQLSITTAGDVHTLTFTIITLPVPGILVDSFGTEITVVPTTLPNRNVTYIPAFEFQGMDSFTFQVDDGLTTATAFIDVVVGTGFGLGDCEHDPAFCDEGREGTVE